MELSRRVSLNWVHLDQVDERIVIQGIDEAAGKDSISAVSRGAGHGQRVTNRRRDTLDITVRFGINIKRGDLQGREEVLEAVNAWATQGTSYTGTVKGGYLRLSHKPGRRLWVEIAQAPGMGNVWQWTNEFSIVFRAYNSPFWEDENETSAVMNGGPSGGTVWLQVPGNAETFADVTVENISGATVRDIVLNIGGNAMTFPGINLGAGEILYINHNGAAYTLRIYRKSGNSYPSAMLYRSESSADDLIIPPGNMKSTMSASRMCRMTVSVRGRYL